MDLEFLKVFDADGSVVHNYCTKKDGVSITYYDDDFSNDGICQMPEQAIIKFDDGIVVKVYPRNNSSIEYLELVEKG